MHFCRSADQVSSNNKWLVVGLFHEFIDLDISHSIIVEVHFLRLADQCSNIEQMNSADLLWGSSYEFTDVQNNNSHLKIILLLQCTFWRSTDQVSSKEFKHARTKKAALLQHVMFHFMSSWYHASTVFMRKCIDWSNLWCFLLWVQNKMRCIIFMRKLHWSNL